MRRRDEGFGYSWRAVGPLLAVGVLVSPMLAIFRPQNEVDWFVADNFGCIAVGLVLLSGVIGILVMNRFAVGDDDEDVSDIY